MYFSKKPIALHLLGLITQSRNNEWFLVALSHHEGEVRGEPDDEDERPSLLLESVPETPKDLTSLRETEQASAGSFFIGVNGGVIGLVGDDWEISSSSDELSISSSLEGDVSGVSNGVLALLSLHASSS